MPEPELYSVVELLVGMPEEQLQRGNVGTLVHEHNEGEAFEVEFVDNQGYTLGLVTLTPDKFVVLSKHRQEWE
ncbi:MAG TPA: DUF4926 domain-containing protein [Pyrinomonadaceae bacterium]|nr:DUF4926 domain-containing protein [Pyrinomonadaceae bacterium]